MANRVARKIGGEARSIARQIAWNARRVARYVAISGSLLPLRRSFRMQAMDGSALRQAPFEDFDPLPQSQPPDGTQAELGATPSARVDPVSTDESLTRRQIPLIAADRDQCDVG
jgi:hypothetical protein